MRKRLTTQQKITYEYTLPGDKARVVAMALTMGYMAALRDSIPLGDRNEIETQARASCVVLKRSYEGQGKQLTNDFVLFCDLVLMWYANCYVQIARPDEVSRAYREEMKRFAEEAGWLQMSHLLQKQYTAQIQGQLP